MAGRPRRASRHALRSRVAHEADRDDDDRHGPLNRGVVGLDDPLAPSVAEWRGADRSDVTVRDLLEHASGLPARLVDAPPIGRREFEHEICAMPLEYAPRTQVDLQRPRIHPAGFPRGGRGPRDARRAVRAIVDRRHAGRGVRAVSRRSAHAPRRRRRCPRTSGADDVLRGEVHDNYAAALGGVAGHAGSVRHRRRGRRVRTRRAARGARGRSAGAPFTPALVRLFTTPSRVPGSSRALGVGHDAADLIVRHADVGVGVRPRRLHRHVAVDRSGSRSVFRAADEPRAFGRDHSTRCGMFAARFTTRLPICEPSRRTENSNRCLGFLRGAQFRNRQIQ